MGKVASIAKMEEFVSTTPPGATLPGIANSACNAVPPSTPNQMQLRIIGMSMTDRINSRNVLPLEICAMNPPTKGVQVVHQTQ